MAGTLRGVELQGIIALSGETDHDTFMDLFLDWLDEHGWEFEGSSQPIEVADEDEDEEVAEEA